MSTLTIKLPDSLLKTIRRLAKAEGMSVNQFVSSAAGEKMAACQTLEHLRREAKRGRRKDYLKFLDAAGDEAPAETDRVKGVSPTHSHKFDFSGRMSTRCCRFSRG